MDLWTSGGGAALRLAAYDGPGRDAPSVVVLHGMVTSVDILRSARAGLDPFARLASLGCNVLALDWPGHGRSGGARGHLGYRSAMDAAAAAVSVAVDRWGGPVGLFGTALGGVLAFYAALEDTRVSAVACHNVLDLRDVRPVLQRSRQGALLPVVARLRAWIPQRHLASIRVPAAAVVPPGDMAEDPLLARALRRHPQAVRSYDLAGLGSIFLSPQDKPAISAQQAPTFIAVGSADRVLPETATRAFASRLTCEHRLWVLPGAGHQLVLEHPAALLPDAATFLLDRLKTGKMSG